MTTYNYTTEIQTLIVRMARTIKAARAVIVVETSTRVLDEAVGQVEEPIGATVT